MKQATEKAHTHTHTHKEEESEGAPDKETQKVGELNQRKKEVKEKPSVFFCILLCFSQAHTHTHLNTSTTARARELVPLLGSGGHAPTITAQRVRASSPVTVTTRVPSGGTTR